MASNLVIKTDLPDFNPVFNRMEVTVHQDDAPTLALPGYQYLIDVYIEGQTFGGLGYYRFTISPFPNTGNAVLDVHSVCESFVSSTLSVYNSNVAFALGANATVGQSIIKVTLKYGYQYLLAGVVTVVADSVVGSAKYAWDACLSKKELLDYIAGYPLYLMNTTNGVNAKFLTDMKRNKVSIGNIGWHHILSDQPTQIDRLKVITYDSAGAIIQTVIKANSTTQVPTVARNYIVSTAPASLNAMTGAFISGAQPIITSSVASYTVQIFENTPTAVSEILYFEIIEPCRYTQRRLHFLNRLGSFDSFNFNLRSQKSQDVSSQGYKMDKYTDTVSGALNSYQDPENITTFVQTADKMILRSDYLTNDENEWLKQLISSPEIYLEFTDPTGVQQYLAVQKLSGSSWLEKEVNFDKLFNMEVEIIMSQSDFRQRR